MSAPLRVEELGPDLFTVSAPLSLAGAQMGTRMTIVRLPDGSLLLIAPIEIDEALAREIAALGPVRAVIAPNAFHHFHLLAALERYPDAACFLAEGVAEKIGGRPAGARELRGEPDALWQGVLEQVALEGAPATNEIVFLHGVSRTLILTDLCFNFDPAPTGWTGLFLRLAGAHGRLATSRLMRALLKDREAVRRTLARILDWDFDNLIVTHGHNIKGGAKARFAEATKDL